MRSKIENNTVPNDTDIQQIEYEYNFFDTPWDDRSQKSRICIVGLLCATFIAIMAVITHNLIVFYTGFDRASLNRKSDINCNVVKVDKYRYAARIHSVATQELICIGAMISTNSVLAGAVCLKSGPIRLYLGNPANHRCKKGFSVENVELIPHDGVITKKLAVIISRENLLDCGSVVRIGLKPNIKYSVFVIGRPYRGGRSLSLQPGTIAPIDNCTHNTALSIINWNKDNLLCVKYLPKCPVWAGDLLVQRDRFIGIASTSSYRENDMAFFANLSIIHAELKMLDSDVKFELL